MTTSVMINDNDSPMNSNTLPYTKCETARIVAMIKSARGVCWSCGVGGFQRELVSWCRGLDGDRRAVRTH